MIFGGGSTIEKGVCAVFAGAAVGVVLVGPAGGVKYPWATHQLYQPDSTCRGSYFCAIGPYMQDEMKVREQTRQTVFKAQNTAGMKN